jgi:pyruvate-ferredoxin/flavodoxin oxidoreductase
VIDAYQVAKDTGMGNRTNTVMQTCFFAISGVLEKDEAIAQIKKAIKKTYGKRGEAVVQQNFNAVDKSVENLFQVQVPGTVTADHSRPAAVPKSAPEFVQNVLGPMIAFNGDELPVSSIPMDGTYPLGTTAYEKRNFALEIPEWDPSICIQCAKCALVCPHAVIRVKLAKPEVLEKAPADFKKVPAKFFKEFPGHDFALQVSPEDCTGCSLCVEACPARNKSDSSKRAINMVPVHPILEKEKINWDYFLSIPEMDRTLVNPNNVKNSQLLQPLFEFSGACAGCGETPYIKLVTQMFGDRMHIANATGCSLHLRRQPAHHPVHQERKAADLPGPTPCSRTTRSSVWACASRWTSRKSTPRTGQEVRGRPGRRARHGTAERRTKDGTWVFPNNASAWKS